MHATPVSMYAPPAPIRSALSSTSMTGRQPSVWPLQSSECEPDNTDGMLKSWMQHIRRMSSVLKLEIAARFPLNAKCRTNKYAYNATITASCIHMHARRYQLSAHTNAHHANTPCARCRRGSPPSVQSSTRSRSPSTSPACGPISRPWLRVSDQCLRSLLTHYGSVYA